MDLISSSCCGELFLDLTQLFSLQEAVFGFGTAILTPESCFWIWHSCSRFRKLFYGLCRDCSMNLTQQSPCLEISSWIWYNCSRWMELFHEFDLTEYFWKLSHYWSCYWLVQLFYVRRVFLFAVSGAYHRFQTAESHYRPCYGYGAAFPTAGSCSTDYTLCFKRAVTSIWPSCSKCGELLFFIRLFQLPVAFQHTQLFPIKSVVAVISTARPRSLN